ncbi:MAG: hypothetical protein ACLP3R_20175 [Candidatus Korobacteraceae bacterium]|jgi:hypothetical protein
MQLHLEAEELNLLAETLLEQVGRMQTQKVPAANAQGNGKMGQAARRYDDLLDKVLARDLRLDGDELEQVAVLLAEHKRDLKSEIVRLQNSALRLRLQQKLELVERVLERVDEARTMF